MVQLDERASFMQFRVINDQISISSFASEGGLRETYVSISGSAGHSRFSEAAAELGSSLEQALSQADVSIGELVFARIFLSDIENQIAPLRASLLYRMLSHGVLSILEQPPLSSTPAALLLYFVAGLSRRTLEGDRAGEESASECNSRLFAGRNYSMLWGANCTAKEGSDSAEQTRRLLTGLNRELEANGMSMKRDLVRTWVFMRDVDNRYQGMVDARREFFEAMGIDEEARYPASTGIEGRACGVDRLVDLDALAFKGLADEQIIKMEALDHLSPTIHYGVTFERGLRIRFGDRSHLHLSGTASIDAEGEVVHVEDVLKQTERTVVNMSALLEGQGASIHHMAYMIVYLRDASSFEAVRRHLRTLIPQEMPIVAVAAPVCRPRWLIEMEGVAIIDDDAPYPPFM
jgi:enamine deaminase RidA (YjgF/YER057c/UK114 family)